MAKEKENVIPIEPEKNVSSGFAFPKELKFICSLCKVAQSRKNQDCPYLNIQGCYCPELETVRSKLVRLERECENHRKYIGAFRKKPFYTEEEMRRLYRETIGTSTPMSEDEFVDYCRTQGFEIV